MSEGRFTLAVGAGEKLNEHIVGRGWPAVDVRQEMLEESIDIFRALWSSEFVTLRGKHLTVEDARIYTLPSKPPDVLVAGSGEASAALAAAKGDGIVAVEPDEEMRAGFERAAQRGTRKLGQVACSYDQEESIARAHAMRFKFGVLGWKVMAELPNPVNFEAATQTVREEDVLAGVS